MEQVVIIVIIGLISLVNWVLKRSAEIREERKKERERLGIPEGDPYHQGSEKHVKPETAPTPPAAPSDDMRRLMEALGIPVEEEPPPTPKPVVRHAEPAALPPLPAFQPPAARPKPRIEKPAEKIQPRHEAAPASPLSLALRSHDGIRQAIVLREILGPPKALAN